MCTHGINNGTRPAAINSMHDVVGGAVGHPARNHGRPVLVGLFARPRTAPDITTS